MSDDKPVILLKAAKELNIGTATAVEFLAKKGFAVDNKPNTKLTGEMYNVLLREFQGDKIAKEEANQIVIGKIRRDESEVIEKTPEPVKKSQDFENEGVLIKNLHQYTPPVEKPVAEKPVEPVKEEPKAPETKTTEQPTDESALPGVKVVGKINLNDLNTKTRPAKKEEAPATPPPVVKEEKPAVVEAPKAEEPPVKAPEPAKTEKPVEAPAAKPEVKAEPVKKAEEPRDEVIKARSVKLSGPNIVGKIELPTTPDRRSQPVASSSDSEAARRKRKRKKTPGTPGAQGQGAPGANQQGGQRQPYQGGNRQGGYQGNRNNRPGYQGNRNAGGNAPKEEPTEKEIQDQIKATLARLSGAGKSGNLALCANLPDLPAPLKRASVALI